MNVEATNINLVKGRPRLAVIVVTVTVTVTTNYSNY